MRMIAWFAFLVAFAPAASAQTPGAANSLRLGTVQLSLGMQQKAAIDALGREFHVEHARGAGDDWAVLKDGNTVAVVSFSGDKLNRISRTWMTSGLSSANTLAERVYTLAGEFTQEGRTNCTLAAKPYRVGDVEGRVVTLACGSKSIQLIQSRRQRSGWVTSLQEVLQ
jgi:hypothetical protein